MHLMIQHVIIRIQHHVWDRISYFYSFWASIKEIKWLCQLVLKRTWILHMTRENVKWFLCETITVYNNVISTRINVEMNMIAEIVRFFVYSLCWECV